METSTSPGMEVEGWHLPCADLGSFASSAKREVGRREMMACRRREEERNLAGRENGQ